MGSTTLSESHFRLSKTFQCRAGQEAYLLPA
ncbi:hypothetical protein CKAH01_13914 [Colletotrichum kahawae]|uniref:Uncharacterized protein n=1 Tax=Colletotrichum kahawae TaxID=34407 RepID=A0AAD9YPP8_COLKA|nr:hypothetical protein CKAH01_13914 [Colletotrichum kahawae]